MTRLSASDKHTIVSNAVEKSDIPKRREEYEAKLKAWAESVRLWVNGEDEKTAADIGRRVQDLISEMPEGFRDNAQLLPYSTYKRVTFDGSRTIIQACWGEYRIVRNGVSSVNVPRGHEIETAYQDIEKLDKQIERDQNRIGSQVWAILDTVTTVAKLLKVWPECRELLPPGLEHGKKLPAVPIKDLNATLGLPSDKARPTPPGAE